MATINMLEETANYLLNHCFVLGSVEDQRAKSSGYSTASLDAATCFRAASACWASRATFSSVTAIRA